MKNILTLSLIILLGAFSLVLAQETGNKSNPNQTDSNAVEKIYTREEVDKEADVKDIAAVLDKFASSFTCDLEGTTVISFVLRKSGKVTDVKVENTAGCKAPEKALAALRKIKFKPAMKGGVAVSQLYEIETRSTLTPGP